jgi:hypothetical protein
MRFVEVAIGSRSSTAVRHRLSITVVRRYTLSHLSTNLPVHVLFATVSLSLPALHSVGTVRRLVLLSAIALLSRTSRACRRETAHACLGNALAISDVLCGLLSPLGLGLRCSFGLDVDGCLRLAHLAAGFLLRDYVVVLTLVPARHNLLDIYMIGS